MFEDGDQREEWREAGWVRSIEDRGATEAFLTGNGVIGGTFQKKTGWSSGELTVGEEKGREAHGGRPLKLSRKEQWEDL